MNLYYNTTMQCRVDENNTRIAQKPTLNYAACPTWYLNFFSGEPGETPVPVDLSDIVSWRAAVDSDWKDNTGPMCRTLSAEIDASQAAQGIIAVPVNANTLAYHSAVNGKQSIPGWFELRGFDDQGNVSLVVLLNITCNNAIDPTGGAEPEPVDNDTATMTWVKAVVAQQLYFQYSADGATWHDPPCDPATDIYFCVKHGSNGTPSAAQLIPYGAAAGFGTPTSTATTLTPGSSATASVTATGPDSQKVFEFSFGIPKGEKGDTGSQGIGVVPGSVTAFAGDAANIPAGYLLCNGASISRTTYADLFAAIGTTYGAGNGSTTFSLPDFRGKFLRGYRSGVSAELGTEQGDAARNITGLVGYIQTMHRETSGDYNTPTSAIYASDPSGGPVYYYLATNGSIGYNNINLNIDASRNTNFPTAAENRPANYAVNYIIKY